MERLGIHKEFAGLHFWGGWMIEDTPTPPLPLAHRLFPCFDAHSYMPFDVFTAILTFFPACTKSLSACGDQPDQHMVRSPAQTRSYCDTFPIAHCCCGQYTIFLYDSLAETGKDDIGSRFLFRILFMLCWILFMPCSPRIYHGSWRMLCDWIQLCFGGWFTFSFSPFVANA
jgi:hypothetical protein